MGERKDFLIGHVKDDLLPTPHLGGPGPYTSVAAARLGLDAHLITKAGKGHEYLRELKDLGVKIHNLPVRDKDYEGRITTGKNFFYPNGGKHQEIVELQEGITAEDWDNFPSIEYGDTVIIAPDIGEVDVQVIAEVRSKIGNEGFLAVSPSGYFRHIENNGKVRKGPWEELDAVRHANLVVLSEDDLVFDTGESLERLRRFCPITVYTQGDNGLTCFVDNQEGDHVNAFQLLKSELKDYDGAGDAAAAAFIWCYTNGNNIKEAGAFAALYAGLKIMGIGDNERGILALPTLEQARRFVSANPERVSEFYRSNGLETPGFLNDPI